MERKKGRQGNAVPDFKENLKKVIVLLLLVSYEVFFFRKAFGGGQIIGFSWDTVLINLILEHWHNVFTGEEAVFTLRSFWPAVGSLGYSDALLVPGVIYSLLRVVMRDPFSASDLAMVLMHFSGIGFLYASLRKLGCSRKVSLMGLFLSLWACTFTHLSYHVQFFSIAMLPAVIYMFLGFWQNREGSICKRLPYGIAVTVFYGLTWLTAFYTAWFFSVFLIFALVIYALINIKKERTVWKGQVTAFVKNNVKEMLMYAVMQLVWLVPFLILYMPAYTQKREYDRGFVITHAPEWWDILRTYSYAPLERMLQEGLPSRVPEGYELFENNRLMETSYGWAVPAFLLFMMVLIGSIRNLSKKDNCNDLVFSASAAIVLLYLCCCRYGEWMPWDLLRHVLPGADTIRATGRGIGIMAVPMTYIVCIWLSEWEKRVRDKKYVESIIFAGMLIWLVWTGQAEMVINTEIGSLRAETEAVMTPPEDCRVFFMCPLDEASYDKFDMNMRAWLIAERFGLHTVNGYSGSLPAEWYLIADDISTYYSQLLYWLEVNGITDTSGFYGYVEEADLWIRYEDLHIMQGSDEH